MEERLGFTFISLLSFKGPHLHNLKGHTVAYFAFQAEMSRVRIPVVLQAVFID